MRNFDEIYLNRPDHTNHGGSGYSNMLNLYNICKEIKPEYFVESGTWRGNSTWVLSNWCDGDTWDIDHSNVVERLSNVEYFEQDIQSVQRYLNYDSGNILFYFDDHVSHLQRLEFLLSIGATHAVFDDNQPGNIASTLKNPPSPTLEELREQGHTIMESIKEYRVLPFHGGKIDTRLTYIRL